MPSPSQIAALRARYRSRGLWRGESLWRTFAATSERSPGREGLVDEPERFSAGGVPERVGAVAGGAARRRRGAVATPLLPSYRERELSFMTSEAGTEVLVVPRTFRGFDHAALAARL